MQRKGDSIKPYIKDDSGKEGWDVIKPQLEEAKAGDTVTVAMNGTTVVPKDVIDSIKGKDTTLVLDMGNGLSWKIYGKDITDAAGDIDFDVTVGADAGKSIPVDVINNVTGEHSSLNLTLAYDGEFGFAATLTVNMESKNAGLYANLFYYNEQTGELEFISAGQIDPDGNVELVFTHASDYTIVVDAKIMSDNGQADNKSDETIPAPKTKTGWVKTEKGGRDEIRSYPKEAVREALVNAIAHRDYSISGTQIDVDIYSDRIEIVSPGSWLLPKDYNAYPAGSIPSIRRNAIIAACLDVANLMERGGTGFQTMMESYKSSPDELQPVVSIYPGFLNLRLYDRLFRDEAIELDLENLTDAEKVMAILKMEGPKPIKELQMSLNYRSRSQFLNEVINPLMKSGEIYRDGKPKSPTALIKIKK